ncbi:hypothetical protein NC652_034780 [Populus alba x Populus x berolinensis]|nr:hypothetical protein NC652_034780 [Populus alba x Populus x berolinensis]
MFGLWEIRWFVLCSGLVSSLSFKGAGCVYSGIQNLHSSIVKGCWWLFKLIFLLLLGTLGFLFGGKLQQWLLFYNWKKLCACQLVIGSSFPLFCFISSAWLLLLCLDLLGSLCCPG